MMQRGAASAVGTIFMIGLKWFTRQGLVFSLAVHVGLLLCLLFVGARGAPPPPPEPMTVEIVPANEAPPVESRQVEGTPLDSTSTGSEVASDSEKGSATAAAPRPKTAAPSLQQSQARSHPQRDASRGAAEPQSAPPAPPETEPQASEPLLPPTAPTAEPQPHPKEAASSPNVGELFAMPLALPGGRLGGGFDAPASNPARLPHDDMAAFRAHVTSCSHLPPGSTIDENIMLVLRVSFNRDGTLASPPKLLDASLSPDVAVLLQAAVGALQNCQPYTELPADKYKKWKTLDLVVTPLAISGG